MSTGAFRHILFALVIALWLWLSVDLNLHFLGSALRYQTAEQVVFYLVIPGVVIVTSLLMLIRRRRKPFSGWDAALVGWPILLFPIYLLPLQ